MVDRVPRDETPRAEEPASPLHDAAERGDIEELRRLISAGVDPDEEDWRGMSPLYCAVDGGSASATRVLLDTGANPNGGEWMSAFVRAAGKNRIDLVRLLLQFGANPDAIDPGDGETALMLAAFHGNLEMVELLLSLGVSPDVVARKGLTALSFAQERGHHHVEERLKAAAGARAGRGPDVRP